MHRGRRCTEGRVQMFALCLLWSLLDATGVFSSSLVTAARRGGERVVQYDDDDDIATSKMTRLHRGGVSRWKLHTDSLSMKLFEAPQGDQEKYIGYAGAKFVFWWMVQFGCKTNYDFSEMKNSGSSLRVEVIIVLHWVTCWNTVNSPLLDIPYIDIELKNHSEGWFALLTRWSLWTQLYWFCVLLLNT